MLTFKQYLTERYKSKHEDHIRQIVSKAREEYMGREKDTKYKAAQTEYGDCEFCSMHVAKELQKHYPSTKVVVGNFYGKSTTGLHDDRGMSGHAWIEIPERKLYVDPTHDQFHAYGRRYPRATMPQRGNRFPDNAVRIAPMSKKHYHAYGYRPNTPPGVSQDKIDSGQWKHMSSRDLYEDGGW